MVQLKSLISPFMLAATLSSVEPAEANLGLLNPVSTPTATSVPAPSFLTNQDIALMESQDAIALAKAQDPNAPELVISLNTDPPRAAPYIVQHNTVVVHQVIDGEKTWLMELEGLPLLPINGDWRDKIGFPFDLFLPSDLDVGGHLLKTLMRNEEASSQDTKILAQGHPAEMIPKIIMAMRAAAALNDKHVDYHLREQNCNTVAAELAEIVVGSREDIPDMDGWEPGKDSRILTDDEREMIRADISAIEYPVSKNMVDEFYAVLEVEKAKVFNILDPRSQMSPQERLEYSPNLVLAPKGGGSFGPQF